MNRFRRRNVLSRQYRVLQHGPKTVRVYEVSPDGPWWTVYTGPLSDEASLRAGITRRETLWEYLKRIFRRAPR